MWLVSIRNDYDFFKNKLYLRIILDLQKSDKYDILNVNFGNNFNFQALTLCWVLC